MENEKNKGTAMTSEKSGTVSQEMVGRRPWHKPTVTRIDLKKTMSNAGSGGDLTGRTGTG